jgi:hypothetical protein
VNVVFAVEDTNLGLQLRVVHTEFYEPRSSVSIVSDYRLDDRAIEVPAGAKNFSCDLCVQTGSGAHPASCTIDTEGPSAGAKARLGVMLTTHPHLVPRSRMSRSYTFSPPSALVACGVIALAFLYRVSRR